MPEAQKVTLALAVCLSEVPVLPKKLLEENLPSVSRALFKEMVLAKNKILTRNSGTGYAGFARF
jgi:hypothetical protein